MKLKLIVPVTFVNYGQSLGPLLKEMKGARSVFKVIFVQVK